MFRPLAVFCTAGAVLAIGGTAEAALMNSGAEDGVLAPWTAAVGNAGNSLVVYQDTPTTPFARTGEWSFQFRDNILNTGTGGGNVTISQGTFAVSPGDLIDASYYVQGLTSDEINALGLTFGAGNRSTGDNHTAFVELIYDTGPTAVGSITPVTGDYQQVSLLGSVVPAGATQVTFLMRMSKSATLRGVFHFDDASLTVSPGVPEPSTLLLLTGVAAAGLIGGRRRR